MSAGSRDDWSLRAPVEADAEAIRAVAVAGAIASWGSFLGAERIEGAWDRDSHPADIVAEDAEGVLGFTAWDAASGEVTRLFIHPRAWDRGVGTALLDAALGALGAAGCERAWLYTEERGERTVAFYERRGFRRTGEVRERDWHGVPLREPVFARDI